jgi:hypothetical protein
MKRKITWTTLILVLLAVAFLNFTPSAASRSSVPRTASASLLTSFVTTLDVDRTDDNAGATACTVAANDCSLRGAILAANADPNADPVIINLQPATTYQLTLTNAAQENAAATGDLDITTTLHSVTIVGGGSAGPNATIIDASALNAGSTRDRAFHITASGVTAIFQDLVIQNGKAADDGTSGMSTNPAAQNSPGTGGGILNGGSLTLTNVKIESCEAIGKGDTIVNQHTTLEAHGGGLATATGSVNIIVSGSRFTVNNANGGNGGNFNNGEGSAAKGGAIYLDSGTLNINLSQIDNSAANGGNGGNQDQNGQTNGGVGGLAQGGGLWVGSGTTATVNDTTFESTIANGGESGTGGNGANPGGEANGGGVYSLGNTTVTNSTFHLAAANGGNGGNAFGSTCLGAHNAGDGGAARGGAIFADSGSLVVNTATFANNSAAGGNGGDGGQTNGGLNCGMHGAGGLAHGGALTNNNAATINLKHGTLSGNNAQAGNTGVNQGGANKPPRDAAEGTGGGIRVGPASVTLENAIVADNTAANGTGSNPGAFTPGPNVDGAVASNGHNLLGVATEATGFTGTGDLTGANAMLAALADNGGPTRTMEPLAGSDAIDAGVAAGATTDQRGEPRTVDDPGVPNEATSDGTDIGAFETEVPCVLTCPSDISVSNDPDECGAVVTYTEPSGESCGTVTCDHPSGSFFPVGQTTVTCTSTAGPSCSFKVTVNDTQAPSITTTNDTLWSPNHTYTTFNLSNLVASVSDNCDPNLGIGSVNIVSVYSDEPDDATADGSTINDIVIAPDCKSVQLRAERKGDGNGRVYVITLKVTDTSGNVSTVTATVSVPNSQSGTVAIDDGPSFTIASNCP